MMTTAATGTSASVLHHPFMTEKRQQLWVIVIVSTATTATSLFPFNRSIECLLVVIFK